jgi:hypothetical protein
MYGRRGGMKNFELEYEFQAEKLIEIVAIALEIQDKTKQEPHCIWGDGLDPIPWNRTEAIHFVKGKTTEQEYLKNSRG